MRRRSFSFAWIAVFVFAGSSAVGFAEELTAAAAAEATHVDAANLGAASDAANLDAAAVAGVAPGVLPGGVAADGAAPGAYAGGVYAGGGLHPLTCLPRDYLNPHLFYNFYVGGNCGSIPAAMYPSPMPTPPVVGHTYYTYQPLLPHEFMYAHKRVYHHYYNHNRGLHRTKVIWAW